MVKDQAHRSAHGCEGELQKGEGERVRGLEEESEFLVRAVLISDKHDEEHAHHDFQSKPHVVIHGAVILVQPGHLQIHPRKNT